MAVSLLHLLHLKTFENRRDRQAASRQAREASLLFLGLCHDLLCSLRSEKGDSILKLRKCEKLLQLATTPAGVTCRVFLILMYIPLGKKGIHLLPHAWNKQSIFRSFLFSPSPPSLAVLSLPEQVFVVFNHSLTNAHWILCLRRFSSLAL